MRERLLWVLLVAAALLWGCALEVEPEGEGVFVGGSADSATDGGLEWSRVGVGVTRTTLESVEGRDVLIVYGGYTATDAASQGWALALADEWFAERGFGEIFAVRGPELSTYPAGHREIQSSRIVRALDETSWEGPVRIVLVAHSSGAFVADELIGMLPEDLLLGGQPVTVTYYNLDGARLRAEERFSRLAHYFPVYAVDWDRDGDRRGESANASVARGEGERAEAWGLGRSLVVDASASGCAAGAGFCLHDALITTRPHDPWRFDVARDYTDFAGGRQVVTDYLEQTSEIY